MIELAGGNKLSLKQIYLNQNIISATKCKKKIEELKKMGIGIYI